MTDRLSILFLESSKNFGGQERRLLFEARWLAGAGHAVAVACPRDAVLQERASAAGLTVHPVPMRGSVHPASIAALAGIIRRGGADVLYSHSGKDSWLGGFAGALSGVPLVRSRELLTPVRHPSAYNLFPRRTLACSEAVRRQLVASGVRPEKVFVQYPPVDGARFQAVPQAERERVRREFRLEERFPVVACVAEFRAEKRQIDLVTAIGMLRADFPRALLLLVGRDAGITGVREAVTEAGLSGQVILTGEREDVPAMLANADIFAFPSSVEPFGMGPVEAMAAGVPVVTTDTGGLAEIVTDGVDGLRVPPLDPAAMARAIARLAGDPELRRRLAEAGRIRARDFEASAAMENLVRHFREVARG